MGILIDGFEDLQVSTEMTAISIAVEKIQLRDFETGDEGLKEICPLQ